MKKILFYTCFHLRQEKDFWEEVRTGLAQRDVSLSIAGTEHAVCVPEPDLILREWEIESLRTQLGRLENLLDWAGLQRNAAGYGEIFSRETILNQTASFIIQLATQAPSAVLVYNDRRREGNLLRQLCRIFGLPCLTVERMPWPGWLSVDEGGMLSDCNLIAHLPVALDLQDRSALADEFARQAGKDSSTWWQQPAKGGSDLRTILPAGKKILLFLQQIDHDAQNFAFNPHFATNLDALRWVIDSLPADGSVFVLGKQHPKAEQSSSVFRALLGTRGHWSDAHSIEECFARADAIVAVNSSLLFEAALTGKPVASLGVTVLHGRGCFAELASPSDPAFLPRLLDTPVAELAARRDRFLRYTEHILRQSFCLNRASPTGWRERGPAALVDFLTSTSAPLARQTDATLPLEQTAATLLHTALHELDYLQRSRLVRLARKLGRLLNSRRRFF